MSQGSTTSYADEVATALHSFMLKHDGPFSMESAAEWILFNDLWRPDRRSAKRELKRLLHRFTKSKKYRDEKGRLVRQFHAAKYPKYVDSNGNKVFETMWDEHLRMTEAHALLSFSQRWDQIAGACRSLKNDSESYNDFNPNGQKTAIQLTFDFEYLLDTPQEQQVERIDVSSVSASGPNLPR